MGPLEVAALLARVATGVVSLGVVLGFLVDVVTKGWVQTYAQRWLGVRQLQDDIDTSHVLLVDIGDGYNALAEIVCYEHDIPPAERPKRIDVNTFERVIDEDRDIEKGDFLRED